MKRTAPLVELFAFRYRHPRSAKWVRARYAATREEIAQRYAEWQIAGPVEVRDVDPGERDFTPHAEAERLGRPSQYGYNGRYNPKPAAPGRNHPAPGGAQVG